MAFSVFSVAQHKCSVIGFAGAISSEVKLAVMSPQGWNFLTLIREEIVCRQHSIGPSICCQFE